MRLLNTVLFFVAYLYLVIHEWRLNRRDRGEKMRRFHFGPDEEEALEKLREAAPDVAPPDEDDAPQPPSETEEVDEDYDDVNLDD